MLVTLNFLLIEIEVPTKQREGIVGTPHYIAPECLDLSCGYPRDVWSIGVMLYYAITHVYLSKRFVSTLERNSSKAKQSPTKYDSVSTDRNVVKQTASSEGESNKGNNTVHGHFPFEYENSIDEENEELCT